jgi:hypothetical protein
MPEDLRITNPQNLLLLVFDRPGYHTLVDNPVGLMLRTRTMAVVAAIACSALASEGRAQTGGDGFLFEAPRVGLSLRTGWAAASANSDLFTFTTGQLTIDRGDFSSLGGALDIDARLLTRTYLTVSVGIASSKKKSEFRDYVDNNELPIEQTTSFVRAPISIGVKQYLMPTGRSIGKFAWVPAKFAPYIGAGGGMMYYRFRQVGDFVDFETMDVFASQFSSDGWSVTAHGLAGIDYSVGPRVALTLETKYLWSRATLSNDFSGFDALDLSGLATTVGLTFRF